MMPTQKYVTKTARIEMQFNKILPVVLIALAVVVGSGLVPSVHAATVTTTQLTFPSERDPVWGQGLTINIGASLPDASIPATVGLDFVGFRTGESADGSPDDRTAVYLHVYDDFGINPDGTVIGGDIGLLVGVSTNTVDLETPADSTDVIWLFNQPSISKNTTYHYILATNTSAATSGNFSNLIYSDFRVAEGNPHSGGQHYRQTGDLGDGPTSRDLFFRVQSSFSTVPEPSTFVLAALGLLSLGFYGRHRRL